jgi:PAS domain S-box-containing protein
MFGHAYGQIGTVTPGLMGPPASISFFLIGISFVLLRLRDGDPEPRPVSRRCVPPFGLFICWLMLLSIVGYLFGAREFYAIPWLSAIAFQTSTMLMALGLALIASVPTQEPMRLILSRSGAGTIARRALPILIISPLALGWLRTVGGREGWFDDGTGRSLLIVSIILITVAVLWNTLRVVANHEEAQQKVDRYIEDTLESLADGFIRLDPEMHFTYVNRQAERMLMERKALLGRRWQDVFPAVVGGDLDRGMQRVLRDHMPMEIENYYEPWKRWYLVKLYPMEDGGLTAIFTDITAQKALQDMIRDSEVRLADELARRTDQVVHAERALARNERMAAVGTLASGLAHDINNIAMPLGLRMERLLKSRAIDAEMKAELTAVTALLDHLRSMAKNLSLFSRDPEQEGIVGFTDLASWWAGVEVLLASSLYGNKGGHVTIRLNGDIPAGLPPVRVSPHRLTQAVVNLVHNARDAIMARGEDCDGSGNGSDEEGAGTITIHARARDDDAAIALKVIDDGCGMAPEVMRRAFEPFYTTKDRSNTGAGSGSGLGLSLVQAICERTGGSLDIESKEGVGTTVTMILPVASDTEEAMTGSREIS